MRGLSMALLLVVLPAAVAVAQTDPPLLDRPVAAALAGELSGETAHRNLEFLVQQHRQRGSKQYRAAAEHIASRLRAYGLTDVVIHELPTDGELFYGTQKSRLAWDAQFAELWELREHDGGWARHERVASFDAMPISLAQDSETADVVAELVFVGEGTRDADYLGKDVRGKLVLTSSQPEAMVGQAVDRRGAVGIVSYAQNQKTGWWKENGNLVRWGHLGSFRENPTFAFMISLERARAYQRRLLAGEKIRFHAKVQAQRHRGGYHVVTAAIEGRELPLEEIVYSCHLDHPRPGANDNASGSVTILEVARTFAKLIDEGRIERPRRTLRFVWPPEIEGTIALLTAQPKWAGRIQAVIHLDMVGGSPQTKAVFHVTRGPGSLPSFVNDVAEALGRYVNGQTDGFASGEDVEFPLVAPEGGKEALLAQMAPFSAGSDHQIYTEGSWRIPAIYLNDWPDRYIHTNLDTPANVDPTKLLRAGFIAAASGYVLADLGQRDAQQLWPLLTANSLRRVADTLEELEHAQLDQADRLVRYRYWYERTLLESVARFAPLSGADTDLIDAHLTRLEQFLGKPARLREIDGLVFTRNPELLGPMAGFGYEYLDDHYPSAAEMRLRKAGKSEAEYEILNLVDGQRSVSQIHDVVSAIFGPIDLEAVQEYLMVLESLDVIRR